MRWLNLEPNIQNEISQKGKTNVHIKAYMKPRKIVWMILCAGQQKETQT